jgi:hypothetical protein
MAPARPQGVFHAAAYDAYMTALVYLSQQHALSAAECVGAPCATTRGGGLTPKAGWGAWARVEESRNRLYLSSKPYPLVLQRSPFVARSPGVADGM